MKKEERKYTATDATIVGHSLARLLMLLLTYPMILSRPIE